MKLSNFATDYSDILAGGPATGAVSYVSSHEAGTASMHVASAVTIADAGNYYTGSTVEAALQELGTAASASSLVVYDESSLIGTPTAMKFAGDGVTATYSGGTATVTVTAGTASTNIPIYDEGSLMGTATSGFNFVGSGVSGTVTSGTAVITISGGTASGLSLLYDSGVLGSAVASIDTGAGGIASGYKDLLISASIRSTKSATLDTILVRWNNDSGTNYHSSFHYTVGSSHGDSQSISGTAVAAEGAGATAPGSAFGTLEVTVPDYDNTARHKMARFDASYIKAASSGNIVRITGTGYWVNTSAISRVQVLAAGGDIAAGSSLRIWGRS